MCKTALRGLLAAGASLAAMSHAEAQVATGQEPIAQHSAAAAPSGYAMAQAAYEAFARQDYPRAAALAGQAVDLEPTRRDYHQLLMQAQANAGRPAEADAAAAELERRFGADGETEAQRGYFAVAQQARGAAADHFARALQLGGLGPATERLVRLGLFDALISQKQPAEALAALDGVAQPEAFDVESRRALALTQLGRREEAGAADARAAALAPTPESRAYLIRARIMSLVEQKRTPEAAQIFAEAMTSGDLDGSDPVDLAMVAVAVHDDATALAYFDKALRAGRLTGRGALDAAYAAKRLGRDDAAAAYFKLGLDRAAAGEFTLAPQAQFEIRRDVASISRRWGAYGYAGYGPTANPIAGLPGVSGHNVAQAGVEVYDRLGGYRHGATIEAFGRVFDTVYSQRGDPTGGPAVQGWIGLRDKPFTNQNLVLEASRMIKLGSAARNDWMLRAAYSAGEGQDLRADRTNWPMWSVYADAARIVDAGFTLAVAEARVGRSFRLDDRAEGTVVSPFLGVAAAYDSSQHRPYGVGIGPGVALREWLREDDYDAPRSFVDLALQYRFRIAGDDREDGLFATLSLAY